MAAEQVFTTPCCSTLSRPLILSHRSAAEGTRRGSAHHTLGCACNVPDEIFSYYAVTVLADESEDFFLGMVPSIFSGDERPLLHTVMQADLKST